MRKAHEAWFELQQVVLTTSTCLNALSCSHVNELLDICVNEQFKTCT